LLAALAKIMHIFNAYALKCALSDPEALCLSPDTLVI
jgi:hypothetical protein